MSSLSLAPDFVFTEGNKTSTIIQEAENGVEQRRARRSQVQRVFKLQYRTRPASEFSTIQSLFSGTLGPYDTFTFTNPNDSVTYTCRFEEDSLEFKEVSPGWYDFDFNIIQVL